MACGCKKRNEQTTQPSSIQISEVKSPAPTQPAPAKQ